MWIQKGEISLLAGAVSKVYGHIYQEILTGERPLGSAISEADVSSKLNVSRSPVREALKILQTEGLVTCYPERGTFVTDMTSQDIEEIFDLRELFETFALKNTCKYMPTEQCDLIEKELLSLDKTSEPETYYQVNEKIHTSIINFSGNKRLIRYYKLIMAQNAIINRISSMTPTHFQNSTQYHLKIIRAIRDRNERKAQEVLLAHLREVREETVINFAAMHY